MRRTGGGRSRRPPRRAPARRGRGPRASARLGLAAALAALALAVGFDRWVATTELPPLALDTSVEVLARDGRLLRAYTVADGRWRLAVDPAEVDAGYLAMLIAYEDRRYYDHAGVDPLAMARALAQAVLHGRRVSGASTLTMQVARLLEDGATGTWAGKLRQVRVALALERALPRTRSWRSTCTTRRWAATSRACAPAAWRGSAASRGG
jgi:penicillin-binding protein 1C